MMSTVCVKLTVSGDMNGFLLCGSMFGLIHTGQVMSLMEAQRKLISQPGLDFAFVVWLQGCLAFGIFGKNPGEVCPGTLPSAVTHCQPEGRVLLSYHRNAQDMCFWKKKTRGDRKGVSSCVSQREISQRKKEMTYSAQECVLFVFLLPPGLDAPPCRSNPDQHTKKTRSVQNYESTPDHQPGLQTLTHN